MRGGSPALRQLVRRARIGLEAIVSKRIDSRYARPLAWLKRANPFFST
jgi:hypothetical protein